MFVFLALVFGLSFVVFGVGSEVPGGIADAVSLGGGNTGQPSVGDARERVEENPRNPRALRQYARALSTAGRGDEAIAPLKEYTELRPRNADALQELAALQLAKADRLRDDAQIVQLQAQELAPGQSFSLPPTTLLGQALVSAPVTDAVNTITNERINRAIAGAQVAFGDTKETYQKLARVTPEDATVQLQLADIAVQAQDVPTAIAAYKRFLELAPDDPNAELVREQLRRLTQAAAVAPPASG